MDAETLLDVELSIASTNNRELLSLCLGSLPAACDGLDWRATVIDNASTDGTAELVRSHFDWARLVLNQAPRGFAANHNEVLGPVVRNRSARYVLVIHEDIELEPGSVAELVSYCDMNPKVGAAGPDIVDPDGRRQLSYQSFPTPANQVVSAFLPRRRPRAARTSGWLDGPCTLMRVDALREIGILDERFFIFFEDVDVALRLFCAGWDSVICDRSRIIHRRHGTVGQPTFASAMELQMLRSRYLFLRKHYGAVRAAAAELLIRVALCLRSAKAFFEGLLSSKPSDRALASLLWAQARYDPRTPLPHELANGAVAQ
jgi:N-acetylglucosaminyl-diphospho-decaprenol L-rhamnosyltransferase